MTRKIQPCGTYAGYQRHRYRGEETCEPCRVARKAYMDGWVDRNPDRMKGYIFNPKPKYETTSEQRRANHLMTRYRMTLQDWDDMFAAQGNACASCGAVEPQGSKEPFQVDHNHQTNVLRGILCRRCNRLIGQLGDCAGGVAANLTRFLSYLSVSGDVLSEDDIEGIIAAVRERDVFVPSSARQAVDPDRPPGQRHKYQSMAPPKQYRYVEKRKNAKKDAA